MYIESKPKSERTFQRPFEPFPKIRGILARCLSKHTVLKVLRYN